MGKHEEEQKDISIALSGAILQKLNTLENLLKKKDDRPLTFREACSYLGYAPSYLYKLTYRKIIPHYKPTGKLIFFSKNEIDAWIFKSRNKEIEDSSEKKSKDVSTSSSVNSEFQLSIKDPNQIEMELEDEVVIEFPLKSRRGQ